MKRFVTLFLFSTFLIGVLHSQTTYKVSNNLIFKNVDCDLTKISLVLPIPYTNEYQVITDLDNSSGDVLEVANNDNKYLRDLKTSGLPGSSHDYTLSSDFNVTLYPMYIDFGQFSEVYPYDTQSSVYKQYTGSSGEYIDPENNQIKRISAELWEQAGKEIIPYARLCYEYVASNFKYLNPNTGLYPLSILLANGGGDCGNLTSIYVSLLRAQGIPSRHIVTLRPNGTYHVWADFYLETYGWVPVDVNMKLDYPQGNYFGYCKGDGIVMSIGINNEIEFQPNQKYTAVLLQTYFWWYWYNGSGNQVGSTHRIVSSPLNTPVSPQIADIKSSQATIEIGSRTGTTGYLVKLYNSDNLEFPVREYRYEASQTQLLLENLTANTSYTASVAVCRKVGMLETTMGTYRLNFVTAESPTSNEEIHNPYNISVNNGNVVIQIPFVGEILICNTSGNIIYNKKLAPGNYSIKVNSGICIIRITDEKGNHWTQKLNCRN